MTPTVTPGLDVEAIFSNSIGLTIQYLLNISWFRLLLLLIVVLFIYKERVIFGKLFRKLFGRKGSDNCPKCGGKLVNRKGKFGDFIGCSNFPKCRYTN